MIEPDVVLWGDEAIVNGQFFGNISSGSYGYDYGKAIALGYLPVDSHGNLLDQIIEIEVAGKRYPVTVDFLDFL